MSLPTPFDFGSTALPSDLKDPFRVDAIERIWFGISKSWLDKSVMNFTATVEFRNGNTKGEQKFNAPDFETLVRKVKDFTESLPKS